MSKSDTLKRGRQHMLVIRKLGIAAFYIVGIVAISLVVETIRKIVDPKLSPEQQKAAAEQKAKHDAQDADRAKAGKVAVGFANSVRLMTKDKTSFEVEQVLTKRDEKTGTIYVCMEWSAKNSFGARDGRQVAIAIYDKDGHAKGANVQGVQSYNRVAVAWNAMCVGKGFHDHTYHVNQMLELVASEERRRRGK